MPEVYVNDKIKKLNTYAKFWICVRALGWIFFGYSIFSFVFWFLNCLDFDWLYHFEALFYLPFVFVRKFYTPEGLSADFTLAIIGGICLVIGFATNTVSQNIYDKIRDDIDDEEERIRRENLNRKKAKKRITAKKKDDIEGNIIDGNQYKKANSKLLLLIVPYIKKIKKQKNEIELTFQEVDIWKQRVNKVLLDNLNYTKPARKAKYRKNLFLLYQNFNFVDDLVYYIKPTTQSISNKFKEESIRVGFGYVFSAIDDETDLEPELDTMDTVLSLNFSDEAIATQHFKTIYENRTVKKFNLELKGEYNLSKNLTVKNKQALYTIILEDKGDTQ